MKDVFRAPATHKQCGKMASKISDEVYIYSYACIVDTVDRTLALLSSNLFLHFAHPSIYSFCFDPLYPTLLPFSPSVHAYCDSRIVFLDALLFRLGQALETFAQCMLTNENKQ